MFFDDAGLSQSTSLAVSKALKQQRVSCNSTQTSFICDHKECEHLQVKLGQAVDNLY